MAGTEKQTIDTERNINYFESKNLKVAYEYDKKDNNKPVILIFYGFGGSTKMMGFFTDDLYRDYPVLIVDYPGHSYSPVNYNYKLDDFFAVINDLLSSLCIKEINLIGYSFGGIMALNFYEKYPEIVKKIVFLHTAPYFAFNFFYKILYKFVKILLSINTYFVTARVLVPMLKDKYFTKEYYKLSLAINKESDSKSVVYFYDDFVFKDFNYLIKLIDIPSLIIGSKKDILVTEDMSKKLSKQIKNSRCEILKEYGHLSVITGSKKISEIIVNFLDK